MPFYEYCCDECGEKFVVRATFKEKDAGLRPRCPLCDCPDTKVVLRNWQQTVLRQRDRTLQGPGGGGCCGPGGGECCG